MRWLYRIQQRIAITQSESNLLLGLVALAALGLVARYAGGRFQPPPQFSYAEEQAAFEQAAAAPLLEVHPAGRSSPAVASVPAGKHAASLAPTSINLNTATAAELQRLPRIGPRLAERILAYRAQHGPFRRVQDLVRVPGIGEKTLAQVKPFLRIE